MADQLISNERRLDMLCGALEGGANHWYNIKQPACKVISSVMAPDKNSSFVDRMFAALQAGKAIEVHDVDDDSLLGEVSTATMTEREYNMLKQQPEHFADILSENDDAMTANVWFQFVVMDKLEYD